MALGDNCRSACREKNHMTFGECARGARLRIGWAASASGLDRSADRAFDRELDVYKSAIDEGIQPASTKPESVYEARRISEITGSAYNSETAPPTGLLPDKRTIAAAQEVGYL